MESSTFFVCHRSIREWRCVRFNKFSAQRRRKKKISRRRDQVTRAALFASRAKPSLLRRSKGPRNWIATRLAVIYHAGRLRAVRAAGARKRDKVEHPRESGGRPSEGQANANGGPHHQYGAFVYSTSFTYRARAPVSACRLGEPADLLSIWGLFFFAAPVFRSLEFCHKRG